MIEPTADRRAPISPQLAVRVAGLGMVAFVLFGIIFFRLWFLQVLSGDQFLAEATAEPRRTQPEQAPRGFIVEFAVRGAWCKEPARPRRQLDPREIPRGARARRRWGDAKASPPAAKPGAPGAEVRSRRPARLRERFSAARSRALRRRDPGARVVGSTGDRSSRSCSPRTSSPAVAQLRREHPQGLPRLECAPALPARVPKQGRRRPSCSAPWGRSPPSRSARSAIAASARDRSSVRTAWSAPTTATCAARTGSRDLRRRDRAAHRLDDRPPRPRGQPAAHDDRRAAAEGGAGRAGAGRQRQGRGVRRDEPRDRRGLRDGLCPDLRPQRAGATADRSSQGQALRSGLARAAGQPRGLLAVSDRPRRSSRSPPSPRSPRARRPGSGRSDAGVIQLSDGPGGRRQNAGAKANGPVDLRRSIRSPRTSTTTCSARACTAAADGRCRPGPSASGSAA
jgi:hypothetical protein